jgi:hypothetical protein
VACVRLMLYQCRRDISSVVLGVYGVFGGGGREFPLFRSRDGLYLRAEPNKRLSSSCPHTHTHDKEKGRSKLSRNEALLSQRGKRRRRWKGLERRGSNQRIGIAPEKKLDVIPGRCCFWGWRRRIVLRCAVASGENLESLARCEAALLLVLVPEAAPVL